MAATPEPPQPAAEEETTATAHAMDVDAVGAAVASSTHKQPTRRVAFAGAEYIEYELDAAPVVRRCGVGAANRSDDDVVLEWRARLLQRQTERILCTGTADGSDSGDDDDACNVAGNKPEPDAAAMRVRLAREYDKEMRATIAARGFPLLDTALVPLQVQFQASELLVAWSVVAPHAVASGDHGDEQEEEDDDDDMVRDSATSTPPGKLDASASLDTQRKHLELCRKQVFGPVVDGYAFGRRFFSIDSFLSLLELEELVALTEAHGMEVPRVPSEVVDKIKVADRELISTYSPTGIGKPLKMLTFRELVEEAYARGILMEDERDGKNKKSKRAWVDALRPALHAEMRAFKIREAHADLIHSFLVTALEEKMQSTRMETIVELIKGYFQTHPDAQESGSSSDEMAAVHRYFHALLEWHAAQPKAPATTLAPTVPPPTELPSPPSQPRLPVEPMSPIV